MWRLPGCCLRAGMPGVGRPGFTCSRGRRLEALFQAPSYSGALDVCYAEARARGQVVAGSAAQEDQ